MLNMDRTLACEREIITSIITFQSQTFLAFCRNIFSVIRCYSLGGILKVDSVMCHLSDALKKAKMEIKASCGMLMIFKECDSFDWCYGCLLHSMVSKT